MEDYLAQTIENKRSEVKAMKLMVSEPQMFDIARRLRRTPLSLSGAIKGNYNGVIAEFKRRSPFRANLNPQADAATVLRGYESCGAAAVAVATDTRFNAGSISDLAVARNVVHIPILRTDLIVDNYQILESYVFGADAVMLVAAILTTEEIEAMTAVAHHFGMEVLLTVGTSSEISKIPTSIDMIGVNNRNLPTQSTNLDISYNMIPRLPAQVTKVSMSGICSHKDLHRLRTIGYSGFIIGESFMKKGNPAEALYNFINPPKIDAR